MISNSSRASVRDLMANWDGRPPVAVKPIVASRRSKLPSNSEDQSVSSPMTRKDSDSSSRGRMGSPSGKSHDSSDSEQSWSKPSGETRLDRLVRRPSSEAKPKPKAKPRILSNNTEHLYDTVALDEDDVYDNHLLYEEKRKSDTIGSGGSISADLGFDEPPLPARRTGTLSSCDTSSSKRGFIEEDSVSDHQLQMTENEEETYVNLQFFMQKRRNTGDSSAGTS